MEQRIRELFATILQVSPEEIDDETGPTSLARWDSIQHLILVAGFEEELGLDVEAEEAVEMYNDFATFKRVILQKLERQS